ncbi:hypothetical protein [Megamonas hypermegale]|uniref:hypothetical protein n=1 Tax=Megamonas hypermegale TaxID=158847 RepID=UPI00242E4EE1|nr:hypothetical protein [Megamonas hypermegale]
MKKLFKLFLYSFLIGAIFFGNIDDVYFEGKEFAWYNIFIIFLFFIYREYREFTEKRSFDEYYNRWKEDNQRIKLECKEEIAQIKKEYEQIIKEKSNELDKLLSKKEKA